MPDDDLNRISDDPIDPRRVNRAVFKVEDADWFLGAIIMVGKKRFWVIGLALAGFAVLRPDILLAILEAIK